MPYACKYATDEGVHCKSWTQPEAEYCGEHDRSIVAVEKMWREIIATIKKEIDEHRKK